MILLRCLRSLGTLLLASAGMSLTPLAIAAEGPKVNDLFPPGAGRGETVEVTASGSFPTWPLEIWCDRPGVVATPAEQKGQFKLTVAADAPSGLYWLRLHDAGGASSPRPLVVDAAAELVEAEPNDAPDKAMPLETLPRTVNGRLAKRGDVDGFAVTLRQGQTLIAAVRAHRLGSPMDPVMQLCTRDGFVLAQNDDEYGLDPLLVYTAPRDGIYVVRLFAFPATPDSSIQFAGGDTFIYRLTLTTGAWLDHALPLAVTLGQETAVQGQGWNLPAEGLARSFSVTAPGAAVNLFFPEHPGWVPLATTEYPSLVEPPVCSLAEPCSVPLNVVVSGRLEKVQDEDTYRFTAAKGQKVRCEIESRALGFPLDARLELLDSDGKVLGEADDQGQNADAALTFTCKADGEYRLRVQDAFGHGGFRHVYRLTMEEVRPDFTLSLAADAFVIEPDQALEIPVTVNRREGFDQPIVIRATGLPEGVSAEPVTSDPKGDSAKSVKLALRASGGPRRGPFRIAGSAEVGGVSREVDARYPVAGLSEQRSDVWLTVVGK